MTVRPFFSRLCSTGQWRWTLVAVLGIGLGVLVYDVAHRSVDFGPYPATTLAMLSGSRDLYGPNSGTGWPMTYRASPLFPLLFVPFALLPLPLGPGLWVLLKLVCLFFVVHASRGMALADHKIKHLGGYAWLAFLIPVSYVVQELRNGNMQFFIICLTVGGLYFTRKKSWGAGALFGLGTNIKLFPGVFLPYLLVRGHVRTAAWSTAFLGFFTFLPAMYFGWQGNLDLLTSWWRDGIGEPTPWKWGINPDHSLRGVMRRYLTVVPQDPTVDSQYPDINFVNLAPDLLTAIWIIVVLAGGVGLLGLAWHLRRVENQRGATQTDALEYALLFCASLLLAPLTQRIYMAALLFPAIVVAGELRNLSVGTRLAKWVWTTIVSAAALLALPPLIPGRMNQRLVAVVSPDFWGVLMLSTGIILLLKIRLATQGKPTIHTTNPTP